MELHKCLAHPQVERATASLKQSAVCSLLHEAVAEAVLGHRQPPLLDHELEPLEFGEGRQQPRPGEETLEQGQTKGAPDHGRGRDQLARPRVKPIETRLQGLLDSGRDRGLADERESAVLSLERAALAQISNSLRDEVWVASGPLGKEPSELLRQIPSGVRLRERARVHGGKRLQLEFEEQAPVPPAGAVDEVPGGVIGVASMDDQEPDGGLLGRGKQLLEQRERGLVGPVEILEHQAQRPFSRQGEDELVEPVERLLPDGVGGEVAHPLLLLRLEHHAEQGGEEGIGLVCLLSERAGELHSELQADASFGLGDAEAEPGAKQLAHRPVGNGLCVGHGVTGEEADAAVEAPLHLGDKARLANPRLACDGDDQAPSIEELVKGFGQRRELVLPADERRFEASRRSFADAHHSEGSDRLALSLQLDRSKVLQLERVPDEVPRARPHDQVAERLQACRHVDRVAERVVEHVRGCVTLGDDHRARVDRHSGYELHPVGGRDLGRVAGERLAERERRPDRPDRVVLVRRGSAEQRQNTVSGQLRDRAAEALDLLAHQPHDLIEQELRPLRAELLADRSRVGNVSDQRGHDPPLTSGHHHGEVLRRGRAGRNVLGTLGCPVTGIGDASALARPHLHLADDLFGGPALRPSSRVRAVGLLAVQVAVSLALSLITFFRDQPLAARSEATPMGQLGGPLGPRGCGG